jgi:hypothetical protein
MAKPTKAHPIRSTQPYLHHETLTQDQQAKFLGVKEETTLNLGHPVPISEIEKNPAGRMVDYANNDVSKGVVRGPARSQNVYGKFRDPKDGHDFAGWASYAREGSDHGKSAKPPTVRDPRGSSVPSAARNKDSDGYLAGTESWSTFEFGGDSGKGRLEKSEKY